MMTPDGKIAVSSQEFGDSWSVDSHSSNECATTQCPISTQTIAWQKCSSLIKYFKIPYLTLNQYEKIMFF
jgi:hypothetical protein